MELENLEAHLILEQKIRAVEHERASPGKSKHARNLTGAALAMSQECQTDLTYNRLLDKEKQLEVKENELEIAKFRSR